MRLLEVSCLAAVVLALFSPAGAEEAKPTAPSVTPLLRSGETVLGQPLAYPAGRPEVTAAIVTIPPGASTGWHSHPVPLFAYLLEGELTVDYGSRGVRVYRAGEALLEALDWPHDGSNLTDRPVRLLAVYLGAEGLPDSTPATGPE